MVSPLAYAARLATTADVPELVRLRAVMFESMGVATSAPTWRAHCAEFLEERIGDGRLIGAVVDAPGDGTALASSALAELSQRMPSPTRPGGLHAHLSSVSTEPGWRRRGMARAVLSLLVAEVRDRGARRAELHATSEGEPLYRSIGFVERPGGLEMRLEL
jgi:GNAT superfamily N-acetyltransferase